MKRARLCVSFALALSTSLVADPNLHIADVGLHGYLGTPSVVRLIVRNPLPQTQSIHLWVALGYNSGATGTVTSDIKMSGGEQRQVELPFLISAGQTKITAQASVGSLVFGRDTYEGTLRSTSLVVLMCSSENVCKTAQSQMQFSGSIEERADKNRKLAFEAMDDPPDDWWAYSAASAVVLATSAKLTPAQRDALDGYLRWGGRLVLVEDEMADPDFLSAYRKTPPSAKGERVGKGTLFRVSGLKANTLGDIFTGSNLATITQQSGMWWSLNRTDLLRQRFAASFSFPRLRWMLLWLAAYIVVVGVLNFAVLRRLRRLEFGWISVCLLALLFAAGFYFSGASRRPRGFRLDNLAAYYLDARSPLAASDYGLRISAPERRDVVVSVADPAVFVNSNFTATEPNGQIWSEMNQRAERVSQEYDIDLGPPRQVELSLLKWSFRDLNLQGFHKFPGTVHFVAPNRLRNDTGQSFGEAIYLDYSANALYALPRLAPGEEIQLDTVTAQQISANDQPSRSWSPLPDFDPTKSTLQQLARAGLLPLAPEGKIFAGFSDGPALPVELNLPHQQSIHSLIVVSLEHR
jgi:hypothetical protein